MVSIKRSSHPNYPTRNKSLAGDAITHNHGGIEHADKFGTDMAIRSATPPPVSEYDDWIVNRNVRPPVHLHRPNMTGFRLRRIVIMRRGGSTWAECGAAVGVSDGVAADWVKMLPLELGV